MKKTTIINLISGPGVGKTLIASFLFANIRLMKYSAEYIKEHAKELIYLKDFDTLNNQHIVSFHQYKLFKVLNNEVDFIVTDGSLLHGLYYNRYNPDNFCNINKTEKKILEWYNEFNNINIFLERNKNVPYELHGRLQTFEERKTVDQELINIFKELNIPIHFKTLRNEKSAEEIIKFLDI